MNNDPILGNVELPETGVGHEAITQKTTKKQPDGTMLDRYARYKLWSYRRWAWEFLRRNEEFQADCKALANFDGDIEEEKSRIAAKFGLKQFKHYNEHITKDTPLRFSATTFLFLSNLTAGKEEKATRHILIRPGEVAVRFDLSAMLDNTWGLGSQIRQVEVSLRKIIASIKLPQIEKQNSQKIVERVQREKLLEYLRMLDHRQSGATQLECWALVKGEGSPDRRNSEERSNARIKLNQAKFYAEHGYRYLAVRVGCPEAPKSKSDELSDN